MKNRILYNWTLPRTFRVIIGVAIIGEAIYQADFMIGIAGSFFTGMGILNIGCCGAGACFVSVKDNKAELKEISYEEIV